MKTPAYLEPQTKVIAAADYIGLFGPKSSYVAQLPIASTQSLNLKGNYPLPARAYF